MIRVAHFYKVTSFDSYGGIESFIDQLTKSFSDKNFIIRVIACTKKNSRVIKKNNIEFYLYKETFDISSNTFSIDFLLNFKKHSSWCDIAHFHFPWPFFDICYLFFPPKKMILTYHADIIRQKKLLYFYKPLMKFLFNKVDRFVFTSSKYFLSSIFYNYFKKKPVFFIPLLFDINDLTILQSKRTYEKKINVELYGKYFVFIGQHRYYKNISTILKAAKLCKFNFCIVGDGPETKSLKKIKANDNLKNVFFLGNVSNFDKHLLLKNAQALILISSNRAEAFGQVLLEASAHKIPMITSEINSGTSYVNIHRKTGYTIEDPFNFKKLAYYCHKLYQNKNLRDKMGTNAKLRFDKLFSIERVMNEYKKIYIELYETK